MSVKISLLGHLHRCPMVTGQVPHVGGPIIQGDRHFTVNGIPVALEGHKCSCQAGGLDTINQGHRSLTINGVAVAYQGASTAHGGIIVQGDDAVKLG